MQVLIYSPAEITDAKVLSHIPEGKLVKESVLLAALKRSRGGIPVDTKASLERLVESRTVAEVSVPGDILSLKPATKFYVRSFRCYPLREQAALNKADINVAAMIQVEGHFIPPSKLFAHPNMPAHWQQETLLYGGGKEIARGSFAEVASCYMYHVKHGIGHLKHGGGKMALHRIGTKFEADPNKLWRAFNAALERKSK